jgi:hypothetical protein
VSIVHQTQFSYNFLKAKKNSLFEQALAVEFYRLVNRLIILGGIGRHTIKLLNPNTAVKAVTFIWHKPTNKTRSECSSDNAALDLPQFPI